MAIKKKLKRNKATKKVFNLENWLRHELRRLSYKWHPRKQAITNARVSRGKYRCASCKGEGFGPKAIQVDHVIPVLDPHIGFVDFNTYIDRLFCGIENFSVLCKPCHECKTQRENEIRRQAKKDEKK